MEKHIIKHNNKGTGAGGANTNKNGLPYESILQDELQSSTTKL